MPKCQNNNTSVIMFVLLVSVTVLFPISLGATEDFARQIINGTDADIKDYPYMISLRYNEEHICGGSIIDEYNILTASHCVSRDAANFSVLVGSTSIQNGGPFLSVNDIKVHGSASGFWPYQNDVAVVQLAEPLEFSESIQPIQLPKAFDPIPELSPAVLTGWGQDEADGSLLDILQKVDITVYSDSECESIYSSTSGTSRIYQLCAGVPEGGRGQCSGDSGGPLVVDGTQIGIVSWSIKPCTREGFPGVFTKVSTYVDWINCNLKTK